MTQCPKNKFLYGMVILSSWSWIQCSLRLFYGEIFVISTKEVKKKPLRPHLCKYVVHSRIYTMYICIYNTCKKNFGTLQNQESCTTTPLGLYMPGVALISVIVISLDKYSSSLKEPLYQYQGTSPWFEP